MRNATQFAADPFRAACGAAGLALCAAALLLAGCEAMAPAEADGTGAPREPAPLQPGDLLRDCPTCPQMVVLPAGTFPMGSPDNEEGRDSDEARRQVRIGTFAVGVYEVTFAEWDACVAGGGCGDYRPDDGGWGRGKRPVLNVSWNDAQAYVKWLSNKTGEEYRLLTEEEWEYAARAGTTTPFHTGPTIATNQANYDGGTGQFYARTRKVGSLADNAFGLYDVHGNVAEMVADCYDGSGGACTRRVSAAARGPPARTSCAPHTGAGARRPSATTTTASASPAPSLPDNQRLGYAPEVTDATRYAQEVPQCRYLHGGQPGAGNRPPRPLLRGSRAVRS